MDAFTTEPEALLARIYGQPVSVLDTRAFGEHMLKPFDSIDDARQHMRDYVQTLENIEYEWSQHEHDDPLAYVQPESDPASDGDGYFWL